MKRLRVFYTCAIGATILVAFDPESYVLFTGVLSSLCTFSYFVDVLMFPVSSVAMVTRALAAD